MRKGKEYEVHGMSNAPEYGVWSAMKQRCMEPTDVNFKDYGGRGITVCDEWKNSFMAFFKDMGQRPAGLSIERRDNNGNYEPSNCYWATHADQAINKRLMRNNTSGICGVSWSVKNKSYKAAIKRDGKDRFLGASKDFFEACCLRKSAEAEYLRGAR